MIFRKLSSIALSTVLVFTLSSGVMFAEEQQTMSSKEETSTSQDKKYITIMHTNDTHGRAEEGKYDGMGFAKVSTLVQQYETENPDKPVVMLDAGDTFHGTTFATLVQGESIAKVMNEVGYDGMAAGNHDFNYGYERLLEIESLLDFPLLSANVIKEDGERLLKPYTIEEVNGVKLGIFGLSTPETHYKTHPNNVKGLTFTDPAAEAKLMVELLENEGVDVIIAVTHLGTDASSTDTSIKVAEEAQGIDIIVDGHSHTVDNLPTEAGTLIVSAGEYTKNLGVVELVFNQDNELLEKIPSRITKEDAAEVTPDADIEWMISAIKTSQQEILSEVVGHTTVALDGEREQVRAGETNLGNLIADAMIDLTGADVALTNGGGIRASIEEGDVTKGDIINVLPFGNYVVTKMVSGADIKAALENGVSAYPETKGAFPHISGMTFTINTDMAAGERVEDLMVKGEPVDLEKEYVLATNDFLAAGGDEYTMFGSAAIVNEYPALDEVLIDFMSKQEKVNPMIDNRIAVKASDVEQPAENGESDAEQPTEVSEEITDSDTTTLAIYVVKPGDTLGSIAKMYNTTWEAIQKANQLADPNMIMPGQTITFTFMDSTVDNNVYIVKPGDSLYRIATQLGTTWRELQAMNQLSDPTLIYPGQEIIVPQ
ncbi:5'-nucleotidase C-terminal domain-containing protein [Longirhabdus pacifica]|uniref:5'-nucleotidase C-terminal domain-containing protein n=1 Tax=Longirhabdus pacifica TaxID=2305227 RepID=UPI001009275D|nr:5'-nucleotidase C-terminal domain-containing protein [Longirhabdus pacifica]